ncbi:MAG: hypothetical protein HFI75_07130 [Lachnospiraceae bacterium]|nr:hypothetical protein [Lachnospiraceae bacterium]
MRTIVEKVRKRKNIFIIVACILVVITILVIYLYRQHRVIQNAPIYISYMQEGQEIQIKIDSWYIEGFVGQTVSSNDTFSKEELVNVAFGGRDVSDKLSIKYSNGDIFEYSIENPNAEECTIKPGSIVTVQYHNFSIDGEGSEQNVIDPDSIIEQ